MSVIRICRTTYKHKCLYDHMAWQDALVEVGDNMLVVPELIFYQRMIQECWRDWCGHLSQRE